MQKEQKEEIKYVRVTEILAKYNDFTFVQEKYREQGVMLHEWISTYLAGIFIKKPKEIALKCENLQKWCDLMIDQIIENERRFDHEILKYSGRIDTVVRLKGETTLTLLDWKSSTTILKTYWAQLAAYKELLRINNISVARAILVPAIAPVKIKEKDLTQPLQGFLAALTAHKYFTGENNGI